MKRRRVLVVQHRLGQSVVTFATRLPRDGPTLLISPLLALMRN
jgi:superfamily II DNA helicase RecQ